MSLMSLTRELVGTEPQVPPNQSLFRFPRRLAGTGKLEKLELATHSVVGSERSWTSPRSLRGEWQKPHLWSQSTVLFSCCSITPGTEITHCIHCETLIESTNITMQIHHHKYYTSHLIMLVLLFGLNACVALVVTRRHSHYIL